MSLETVSNGGPHANSVCEKGGSHTEENHTYSGSGSTSRRISAVRKTLAGWLRLDRSTSTQGDTSQSNHNKLAQRSKSIENVRLTGRQPVDNDVEGVRGRNEERRVLSWGNWRRRMTSRSVLPNHNHRSPPDNQGQQKSPQFCNSSVAKRALPPVPSPVPSNQQAADVLHHAESPEPQDEGVHGIAAYIEDRPDFDEDEGAFSAEPLKGGLIDFAASIEKVKSYGWYWGPISREASERLLEPEPDGSFIVRDSSADHYIFSLTFKLNGNVSHVRIEHDQGNFSFGSLTKFKSNTIVDFIENAVEHSRSGRYLFFLHRRPERGPMRVQLLNPVSRNKQIRSLQHMCRFVILALVPRDLLHQLPVPKRIRTYLDTPFYYSETIADWPTVPGNEPVSLNLSNDDGGLETVLQTFSGQPLFPSLLEEDRLLPSASETQTDTTQTYQIEEALNATSPNVVMSDAIMPESSSANVSSQRTLQSTGSAKEESQNLSEPSNDNVETNDSEQSPIISASPSLPLVLSTHILRDNHNLEQELVNSENNSIRNNCDALPPSNSKSSSHQQSSSP